MIHFSQHKTAIKVTAGVGATAIVYGLAIAPRGRRAAPLLFGIACEMAAMGAAMYAVREDRELVRNPEVMNGHFLTGGQASALADADDVPYLRSLMGVPTRR